MLPKWINKKRFCRSSMTHEIVLCYGANEMSHVMGMHLSSRSRSHIKNFLKIRHGLRMYDLSNMCDDNDFGSVPIKL